MPATATTTTMRATAATATATTTATTTASEAAMKTMTRTTSREIHVGGGVTTTSKCLPRDKKLNTASNGKKSLLPPPAITY